MEREYFSGDLAGWLSEETVHDGAIIVPQSGERLVLTIFVNDFLIRLSFFERKFHSGQSVDTGGVEQRHAAILILD
jgi:hypothetical protein